MVCNNTHVKLFTKIGGTAIDGDSHSYSINGGIDFLMDDVNCIGNENDLTSCNYNSNHDCDISKEIAAVNCGNSKYLYLPYCDMPP